MTKPKIVALVEHTALTLAGALTTALMPYLACPGLSHVTAAQWRAVADHVLAALVVVLGALAGTPMTRKYGVGSSPTADGLPTS